MALDDWDECDERRAPSAEEDAAQASKALPPPALAGGVKAEIIWRGDVATLAFPGGREFPTNIRREGVQASAYGTTASAGLPTAKIIRLGSQTMWGDIDWFCFPCDMMAASGSPGTAVFGIACGKHHAVAFKLTRGETDGAVAFLTDDNKDEDEIVDDDIASTSSLSANLRTARGIRCSVASGDCGWIAATILAGGRECEVHVWKPLAVADRAGWTWLFTGTARFVLPLGFRGNVADAISIDGECAVLRQIGYPDLRFRMRSPRHIDAEPEDGLRWSCGEAVWGLLGVAATAGAPLGERLDRQVTILCRPTGLPSLSAAWERKGMLAARVECERMDACPIYVECRRNFDSSGLRETIRAVDAERVLILLNITEPSDTTWASAGLSDELCSFLRDVRRNSRSRDSFRCIVLASPSAAAAAYDIFDGYDMARMLGPYSEMSDAEVLVCLCEDAPELPPPARLAGPYAAVKKFCRERWESAADSDTDYDDDEGVASPFMLPVAQMRRLLREAAEEAGDDDRLLMECVESRLGRLGRRGVEEMPEPMRRRLAELPLLLRETGGEVLYGQDEAIWATQRHIQAHLIRSAEDKPTFIFYVGPNGLGKTTLALNSIRAVGGAMEEVNCSSLDNKYGYGDQAGFTVVSRKVAALHATASPLKALLLDEVDKNLSVLKALIKLADSDAATRSMLDHPLAGIFVFITMNVLPDCDEYRRFVEEDEPADRLEKLRDLMVASFKNVSDTKIVHAIISRLVPYLVVFNELDAKGDRGRRQMVSLAEDELRGFAADYKTRAVLDDDAMEGLVRRAAPFSVGGFRSVRAFMRREIESAIGAMRMRDGHPPSGTIVLRDAGKHLTAASAGEGDTVLYALAVTRFKRMTATVKAVAGRMMDAAEMRDDDKMGFDQCRVMSAAYSHISARPLFSVKGSEAKFESEGVGLVDHGRDEETVRRLKAVLAELRNKVVHHSRTLLDTPGQVVVDAAVRDLLAEAKAFYRLSLPDDPGRLDDEAVPAWIREAWRAYLETEERSRVRGDAVKRALAELVSEWARLARDQDEHMSDVLKFPELRAKAAARGSEIAAGIPERAERLGLDERTLWKINGMVIDAWAEGETPDEKKTLMAAEALVETTATRPMSVHLLAGAATAFLIDRAIRDMLRDDYAAEDRRHADEVFRGSGS